MSRTIHDTKGPGWEFWSRRPGSGYRPGRKSKVIIHRLERRRLLSNKAKKGIWDFAWELVDAHNAC